MPWWGWALIILGVLLLLVILCRFGGSCAMDCLECAADAADDIDWD